MTGEYDNDRVNSSSRNITQDEEIVGKDSTLRSVHQVTGYNIKATDAELGEIKDFIIDDKDWSVKFIILDTAKWLPGKKVSVQPEDINRISWREEKVSVNFTKDEIKNKPEFSMKEATFTV
jgi:hypothetical protein